MTVETLLVSNDNVIEIPSLTNGMTAQPINGANVQLTLYDLNGTPIAGEVWPLVMAYVPSSKGTYRATASYTLPLSHGQRVQSLVVADAGPGLRGQWDKIFKVIKRT